MKIDEKTTDIWQKYERGREQHIAVEMYKNTERCHRFYEGAQWHGLQSGSEELPVLNFIKPICTYKIATVAMNTTAIVYSCMSNVPKDAQLCTALNAFAARLWEKTKMERLKWEIVKNACIVGDSYLYCFDKRMQNKSVVKKRTPQIGVRIINKTDIYFADEQCSDMNEQEWIILAERVPVFKVRKIAEKNGISQRDIEKIVSDGTNETNIGVANEAEVQAGDGKCTSLLFMRKTDDGIEFCRSCKNIIYQNTQLISQLDAYPICAMRWLPKLGSSRGVGVVQGIIANQIEVNRTIARRAVMIKKHGFASLVYDQDKVVNPDSLGKVGAAIAVRNLSANPISSMVEYLTPAPMGNDAAALQGELVSLTRELEGASEAATGQINPERASGEAIKAARDQSVVSLNEQSAAYKQFVEELAIIWLKMWAAYAADGVEFGDNTQFTAQELLRAELDIRIDISPADPYSILSRQLALEGALSNGHISFEEYVELLDKGSGVPQDKFRQVLQARQKSNAKEAKNALPQMPNRVANI